MKWHVIFLLTIFILSFNLLKIRLDKVDVTTYNGYPVHNLDTGLNYTSIQEAINAPETLDGHTIFVEEGTYFEHVIVSKSLTLLGEGREVTIIDGSMTGNVVRVTRDYVNITGFTIQRGGHAYTNSGIYVGSTRHCDISANYIVDSDDGVFGSPRDMSVTDNIIEGNFLGVALDSGATNNVIFRNHLVANYVGVHLNLADANFILQNNMTNNQRSVTLWDSSNNRVYHNNFLNDTFGSTTYANFLDNGLEGNYWSNHTGVDLNHDGIGDSPYVIDANNTDYCPLMGMFHSFNTSLGEYANVISNSTIEDFEYFESNSTIRIHVSNASSNQTFGFCRVRIPHTLINETIPLTVLVNGTEPYYWNYTLYDDGNNRWIHFVYEHSTLEIVIVPEFPSLLILPLFTIATLLTVTVYKRKRAVILDRR